jgi:hypothetical protein
VIASIQLKLFCFLMRLVRLAFATTVLGAPVMSNMTEQVPHVDKSNFLNPRQTAAIKLCHGPSAKLKIATFNIRAPPADQSEDIPANVNLEYPWVYRRCVSFVFTSACCLANLVDGSLYPTLPAETPSWIKFSMNLLISSDFKK